MKLIPYIFRELKNNYRFALLFVFNLSMGLAGFIALDGFKASINQSVQMRSQSMLGADFGISARRPLKDQEIETMRKLLGPEAKSTRLLELYSMVAGGQQQSRLVQIKAVESDYPFYGDIGLQEGGSRQALQTTDSVWVDNNLAQQLQVSLGDSLKIGGRQFVVADIVSEDATAGITSSMAPRLYMGIEQLQSTGLVTRGTIAWHSILYHLPETPLEGLNSLRDRGFAEMQQPDLKIFTHENVSTQMATLVSRLNDFLGLASLVALFLAGVGSSFLFRAYFRQQVNQVAILLSLGLSRSKAFLFYLSQSFVLGIASALVAALLSLAVVKGLGAVTAGLLPFPVTLNLKWSSAMLGLILGGCGSVLLCLPSLTSLRGIKALQLLGMGRESTGATSLLVVLAALPGVLLFWLLSMELANSYWTGSVFTGLFLASVLILCLCALILFTLLGTLSPSSLGLKLSLRDLARNKLSAGVCFVAIGLGSLLLNLIPQINSVLSAELERPGQSKVPSLFMFDIQEEQISSLEKILEDNDLEFDQVSPMIRARLMTVNGIDFDKGTGLATEDLSREKEAEMRFRNRGFNLSYRASMSAAESIIEGEPLAPTFDESSGQLPEISVEQRFAGRLGLELGDRLVFDIESLPVEGVIKNLRTVQWTSFQPNFFIQFQPGVLEMAPKTFVATLPGVSSQKKLIVQSAIVREHPNVSMIDVSRVVKALNAIIKQMGWALSFMSLLCLIAGFIVIFSIANHQAMARRWDIGLLKALGASFSVIRQQFLWQFAIISFSAVGMGALLSLIMSYVFSSYLFSSLWIYDWQTPVLSLVIGVSVSLLVTELAIRGALKARVNQLFL